MPIPNLIGPGLHIPSFDWSLAAGAAYKAHGSLAWAQKVLEMKVLCYVLSLFSLCSFAWLSDVEMGESMQDELLDLSSGGPLGSEIRVMAYAKDPYYSYSFSGALGMIRTLSPHFIVIQEAPLDFINVLEEFKRDLAREGARIELQIFSVCSDHNCLVLLVRKALNGKLIKTYQEGSALAIEYQVGEEGGFKIYAANSIPDYSPLLSKVYEEKALLVGPSLSNDIFLSELRDRFKVQKISAKKISYYSVSQAEDKHLSMYFSSLQFNAKAIADDERGFIVDFCSRTLFRGLTPGLKRTAGEGGDSKQKKLS